MTNVVSLQQIWLHYYQLYHLKQPVFRMIADEKIGENLSTGDTINFRQMPDFYYDSFGTDGTYTAQGYTEVNETLTIAYRRAVPIRLVEKDLEQQDTNMKVEYAQLAMNRLFIGMDADVLMVAFQGAFYVLDNGILTGGAATGVPITMNTPTVIPTLFAIAQQILQLANVVYDPNLSFSRDVKLKIPRGMCVSIISPQVFTQLVIYLGGKTTVLGDKVSVSGHQGAFMGFNIYISNNLPTSVTIALPTIPTAADTFTLNGVSFQWAANNSATNPGDISIGTTAATAQTNLINALAAPFTTVTNTYVSVSNTTTNQLKLYGLNVPAFVANASTIQQAGNNIVITSVTSTPAGNIFGGSNSNPQTIQHNIFGISNSVAMCLQGTPRLRPNPVSNAIATDWITWTFFGLKVFKTQAKQLIDVQVNATGFTTPLLTNY